MIIISVIRAVLSLGMDFQATPRYKHWSQSVNDLCLPLAARCWCTVDYSFKLTTFRLRSPSEYNRYYSSLINTSNATYWNIWNMFSITISIIFFTQMKLCHAAATHSFKWVNITWIYTTWIKTYANFANLTLTARGPILVVRIWRVDVRFWRLKSIPALKY